MIEPLAKIFTIFVALRVLVPFGQFKKREKHPDEFYFQAWNFTESNTPLSMFSCLLN